MPTREELAESGYTDNDWRLAVEHLDDIEGSRAGAKLTFPDSGVDDIEVTVLIASYGSVEVYVEGKTTAEFNVGG